MHDFFSNSDIRKVSNCTRITRALNFLPSSMSFSRRLHPSFLYISSRSSLSSPTFFFFHTCSNFVENEEFSSLSRWKIPRMESAMWLITQQLRVDGVSLILCLWLCWSINIFYHNISALIIWWQSSQMQINGNFMNISPQKILRKRKNSNSIMCDTITVPIIVPQCLKCGNDSRCSQLRKHFSRKISVKHI